MESSTIDNLCINSIKNASFQIPLLLSYSLRSFLWDSAGAWQSLCFYETVQRVGRRAASSGRIHCPFSCEWLPVLCALWVIFVLGCTSCIRAPEDQENWIALVFYSACVSGCVFSAIWAVRFAPLWACTWVARQTSQPCWRGLSWISVHRAHGYVATNEARDRQPWPRLCCVCRTSIGLLLPIRRLLVITAITC